MGKSGLVISPSEGGSDTSAETEAIGVGDEEEDDAILRNLGAALVRLGLGLGFGMELLRGGKRKRSRSEEKWQRAAAAILPSSGSERAVRCESAKIGRAHV